MSSNAPNKLKNKLPQAYRIRVGTTKRVYSRVYDCPSTTTVYPGTVWTSLDPSLASVSADPLDTSGHTALILGVAEGTTLVTGTIAGISADIIVDVVQDVPSSVIVTKGRIPCSNSWCLGGSGWSGNPYCTCTTLCVDCCECGC